MLVCRNAVAVFLLCYKYRNSWMTLWTHFSSPHLLLSSSLWYGSLVYETNFHRSSILVESKGGLVGCGISNSIIKKTFRVLPTGSNLVEWPILLLDSDVSECRKFLKEDFVWNRFHFVITSGCMRSKRNSFILTTDANTV